MAPSPNALLLYDQDCGFCKLWVAGVLRWDSRRRVTPLALQDARSDLVLEGLDPQRRMASWHLASPDRPLRSGGAVFADLIALMPHGRPLARLFALLPGPLLDWGYDAVASRRTSLGRRLPRLWVARAERLIQRRTAEAGGDIPGGDAEARAPRVAAQAPHP